MPLNTESAELKQMYEFIASHGDGVKDIAIEVQGIESVIYCQLKKIDRQKFRGPGWQAH